MICPWRTVSLQDLQECLYHNFALLSPGAENGRSMSATKLHRTCRHWRLPNFACWIVGGRFFCFMKKFPKITWMIWVLQMVVALVNRFLFQITPKSNLGVSKNRGKKNQKGWFIMENLIKMDDLGGPPLFLETPICCLLN